MEVPMKTWSVCTLVLAFCNCVLADDPPPWANKIFGAPEKLSHDFGKVKRGTQVRHEFEVTNIDKAPLEIIAIRTSAGAGQATAIKKVLQPKEKTTIILMVDTNRFVGSKTGRIYVTIGPR
jgi:hypothetical protein